MMVAPVGIFRYHDAESPADIPRKPAITEINITFPKFFVYSSAILGGMVSRDSTSTTPAILILSTITSDTSTISRYLNRSTRGEKVLA